MKTIIRAAVWSSFIGSLLFAQQPAAPPPATTAGTQNTSEGLRPNYVLGPGDQIVIRAFQVEEISDKPFRIGSEGEINLPVVGTIQAGGLTVDQLEAALMERLKRLVKNPQVSVSVVQFRSEPVFLQGAFKAPGIYPLQGRRTLLEMMASSGGLAPNASRVITVSRHLEFGKIPLPAAQTDPEKKTSTVRISLASLQDNINPAEDIVLQPMDVITADQAQLIYVNGEVTKVGGLELAGRDSLPVTQAISLSGGLTKDADAAKARILRPVLNTSRRAEIPVDLKRILAGKAADFPLLPNDVLYVPRSSHRAVLTNAALFVIPAATGLIYVMASKL